MSILTKLWGCRLAAALLAGLALTATGIEPFAARLSPAPEQSAADTDADHIPAADSNLINAKSIFVEPMSEGFDRMLVRELRKNKDLYTVTTNPDEADLWMKGVLTVVETGLTADTPHVESDMTHSHHTVTATASIVVVPRSQSKVLWEGEADLKFMPGTRIPIMARVIVEKLRKAVKEARKAAREEPKNP